jgi:hypothetical protein
MQSPFKRSEAAYAVAYLNTNATDLFRRRMCGDSVSLAPALADIELFAFGV